MGDDSHNSTVSHLFTRSRLSEVSKSLRLTYKDNIGNSNKCVKVRPLIVMPNKNWLYNYKSEIQVNIDESVVHTIEAMDENCICRASQ